MYVGVRRPWGTRNSLSGWVRLKCCQRRNGCETEYQRKDLIQHITRCLHIRIMQEMYETLRWYFGGYLIWNLKNPILIYLSARSHTINTKCILFGHICSWSGVPYLSRCFIPRSKVQRVENNPPFLYIGTVCKVQPKSQRAVRKQRWEAEQMWCSEMERGDFVLVRRAW